MMRGDEELTCIHLHAGTETSWPVGRDAIHRGGSQVTELLEERLRRRPRLSDREQDVFARCLMDELESEQRRSQAFEPSQDRLAEWTREAVEDDLAGRTEPLDPDRL